MGKKCGINQVLLHNSTLTIPASVAMQCSPWQLLAASDQWVTCHAYLERTAAGDGSDPWCWLWTWWWWWWWWRALPLPLSPLDLDQFPVTVSGSRDEHFQHNHIWNKMRSSATKHSARWLARGRVNRPALSTPLTSGRNLNFCEERPLY